MEKLSKESLRTSLKSSGARAIAQRLILISGGKVLDIATGKGDFIQTLSRTLGNYDSFIGIDVSQEELEVAREKCNTRQVEFFEMDAEHLDFDDETFDTVCIANSLHHLVDVDRVLVEMKRVLKVGGYFIVQEPFCDGEQTEAQKSDIMSHHFDAEIDSLLGIPHRKTYTKEEIRKFLDALEFEEVEVFESTRYVKCLFCEDKDQCDNPKNEALVKFAIEEVDDNLTRLRHHNTFKEFEIKAKKIKKRFREFGSASASYLFFLGRKLM